MEQLLRRVRLLPRTAQIGLRDVARRRRRGISTVLQVGLAVATLLAFLSLATSVGNTVNQSWSSYRYDIDAGSSLGRTLANRCDADCLGPGVAQVQPQLRNNVKLAGHEGQVWAPPRSADVQASTPSQDGS